MSLFNDFNGKTALTSAFIPKQVQKFIILFFGCLFIFLSIRELFIQNNNSDYFFIFLVLCIGIITIIVGLLIPKEITNVEILEERVENPLE